MEQIGFFFPRSKSISGTHEVRINLFVVLKYLGKLKLTPGPGLLCVSGGIVGFLSGLAGSAGQLGAAIFLSLGLPPVAYVASEATTALAMHAVKTVVYQQYIALDHEFRFLAVVMRLAMVLGTWSAKRVIEYLPREKFEHYVATLLVGIAVYMTVHG